MGVRSDFERRERDFYVTPESAVIPLVPHLPANRFMFGEPCAGDGALIDLIHKHTNGSCIWAIDIEPGRGDIAKCDMFDVTTPSTADCDILIANPPWRRDILHPFIEKFSAQKPLWVLLDANWANTRQAQPYLAMCHKIVATGRHKWIPGTKMAGKDDASWFLFNQMFDAQTTFYPRTGRHTQREAA